MKNMYIYIDILIVVNLFVNYFLLLTTTKLLHISVKRVRLILSAVVGALSSLIILLPQMNFFFSLAVKIPLASILIFIAFGYKTFAVFVRHVLCFFAVNFIYAGVMFAVWYFSSPSGMYYNNGLAYFNVSVLILTLSTICAYLLIIGAKKLFNNTPNQNLILKTEIEFDGKCVTLDGFVDTGNNLKDIFTGFPVVIAEFDKIKDVLPINLHDFFLFAANDNSPSDQSLDKLQNSRFRSKIRMIPYQTINKSGLLAAFKPDRFEINETKHDVLIGVKTQKLSSGEYSLLLNVLLNI